jgi:hypothetical protein
MIVLLTALLVVGAMVAGLFERRHWIGDGEVGPPTARANPITSRASLLKSRLPSRQRVPQKFTGPPLSFEANRGQTDARVKFLSRSAGYTLFLTANESIFAFRANVPVARASHNRTSGDEIEPWSRAGGKQSGKSQLSRNNARPVTSGVLRMRMIGASPAATVTGIDELAGRSNYFIGSDPAKWHSNVPGYSKVYYSGLYPGVDLVYYGNEGQLEYDFVVAPGGDPEKIQLSLDALPRAGDRQLTHGSKLGTQAVKARIDPNGNLVVTTGTSDFIFHKPVAYQTGRGTEKHEVPGRFVFEDTACAAGSSSCRVAFRIGAYNHAEALIIDPVLSYSTYLGGSDDDQASALAVDSSGNAYITGQTYSVDFPVTSGVVQPVNAGNGDVFVTKLSPDGSSIVYSTYLGGSNSDFGQGIALDSVGDVYLAGYSYSADFPVTPGAFQTTCAGACGSSSPDAFVTELNPTGSALIYSTYLGGSGFDEANGIALDRLGHAYVIGWTGSANFPVTPGAAQTVFSGGYYDAFVAKLNTKGSGLLYATYLGGTAADFGYSIALDAAGEAYVTGYTKSPDFPTVPGAFQNTMNAPEAAFVTKLNTAGTAMVYSTYLGGSGTGSNPCAACGAGITLDSAGNAYVSGLTWELNFPTTAGALQTSYAGGYHDGFLTKLNPTGSGLIYSTYIGGTSDDGIVAVRIDASGNLYARGNTFSKNFPVTPDAFQPTRGGNSDAVFFELNPSGSALIYSTYLGGSGSEFGWATNSLALQGTTKPNIYLTGYTNSTNFPVSSNAFQPTFGGVYDAFVTKFTP